jgi:ketosteroid isomerase-like protein
MFGSSGTTREATLGVTEEDLAELAKVLDRGRDAWIHGHFPGEDDGFPITQPEDATIFGPFGGVAPKGVAPRVRPDVQREMAARFGGGSGSTDVVRFIVEGELVVVAYVDRSTVRFDGNDSETPWMLRTTEVFRKVPDGWARLHRHADPLVRFRDLDSTRRLLD